MHIDKYVVNNMATRDIELIINVKDNSNHG